MINSGHDSGPVSARSLSQCLQPLDDDGTKARANGPGVRAPTGNPQVLLDQAAQMLRHAAPDRRRPASQLRRLRPRQI